MRKQVAAVTMAAATLGGVGAGVAFGIPTVASAEDSSESGSSVGPGTWVKDALAKLVSDGTIDQSQADAVAKALEAARPEGPGHGPGGAGLGAAATAIGIELEALRTELGNGSTIADVARARGVDVNTVIDAIVAQMGSNLDDAVASGRLTQAQADEMKANATERATALVNGEMPPFRGDHAPDASAESSSTSSSSS